MSTAGPVPEAVTFAMWYSVSSAVSDAAEKDDPPPSAARSGGGASAWLSERPGGVGGVGGLPSVMVVRAPMVTTLALNGTARRMLIAPAVDAADVAEEGKSGVADVEDGSR
jgi:hypothetical protein